MRRFLCWLGVHKWKEFRTPIPGQYPTVNRYDRVERRCEFCPEEDFPYIEPSR